MNLNIFNLLWSQLVSIPLTSFLSYLYVILNAALLAFASFFQPTQ